MLHEGYVPQTPRLKVRVPGDPGVQTFRMLLANMVEARQISPYDRVLGEAVATVLCGGTIDAGTEVSEQYFLDLERNTFVELCQKPETQARIEHMLKTGKPLRN
jgi:3-hydroxyacyl-CoA dehydrogenase